MSRIIRYRADSLQLLRLLFLMKSPGPHTKAATQCAKGGAAVILLNFQASPQIVYFCQGSKSDCFLMLLKAAYVGIKQQTDAMTDRWLWAIKAAPMQGFDGSLSS